MIDLHGQISMGFLKKRGFTGSYKGMRYLLKKKGESLEAVVWPEPFNFETTEEEKKHGKEFPFHEEGLWEAVAWLNQEFEAGHF